MKKLISILLALIMLMALAVPAFALLSLRGELSGDKTYDDGTVKFADATVTSGTNLIFNGSVNIIDRNTLTVESNASVMINLGLTVSGNLIVKSGGTVTANSMNVIGNLTVEPGGTVIFSESLSIGNNSTVEIGGTFSGGSCLSSFTSGVTLLESGKFETKFTDEKRANAFAEKVSKYKTTITEINDGDYRYLVTVDGHVHDFTRGECECGELCPHNQGFTAGGKCVICSWQCPHEEWNDGLCEKCGYACKHEAGHLKEVVSAEREYCPDCDKTLSLNEIETTTSGAGSTISEGNMTIVVGVTAAVIFGLGGFILGRRKKA